MTKLLKRIIIINQRRTSMRLCQEEWNALDDICRTEKTNRNTLIGLLENIPDRKLGLTYLTRLFMLMYYRDAAEKPDRTVCRFQIPASARFCCG